jgi:hypothetical protein
VQVHSSWRSTAVTIDIERRGWWRLMGVWSSGGTDPAASGGVELVQGRLQPPAGVGISGCATHDDGWRRVGGRSPVV